MLFGQGQQALEHAYALDAACPNDGLAPFRRTPADAFGLGQHPGGAAFDVADLLRGDVRGLRAEPARLLTNMQSNDFHTLVADAYQPAIPARPNAVAQIFRRHGVISPVDFDMAIATDDSSTFVKERKTFQGQRSQGGTLHLVEYLGYLLTNRAVDAPIRDRALPVEQMPILFFQAGKGVARESVLLHVGHA